MKRIIAGLAIATAATLVTVAPAQAAPVNPVKTLKKHFVPGHGVRISETTRNYVDGKETAVTRTTGAFAFGRSGVVASDLTTRFKAPKGAKDPASSLASALRSSRTISVGGHVYAQGGVFSESLPEGKKWVRYPGDRTGSADQLIDALNPKVLALALANAKPVKGDYRGTITYKELAKLYKLKAPGRIGAITIKYLLDTDAKGQVARVVSEWTLDFGLLGTSRSVTETRYTGWGSKVTIKAPAKSQWVDVADLLAEDAELPKDIPDNAVGSLGQGR